MEDLNAWVTTIASWITIFGAAAKVVKWLLPEIRENLKTWRVRKRKR